MCLWTQICTCRWIVFSNDIHDTATPTTNTPHTFTHTHIHTGPPLFTLTPSDITVPSGQDVTFQCEAVGPPAPSYTWTRIGRTLQSSAVDTGTTLNLFSVSTDDAGVYQCTAGSSRGTINAQATLTVLCKPLYIEALCGVYVCVCVCVCIHAKFSLTYI